MRPAATAALLFALRLGAQDLYVDFNALAAGQAVGLADMARITRTNGSAVRFAAVGPSDGGLRAVGYSLAPGLIRPFTVGGVTVGTAPPTRALLCDPSVGNTRYLRWDFASSKRVSWGYSLRLTNFLGLWSYYNPFDVASGSCYSALSLIDTPAPTLQAETNSNVGAKIPVPNNANLWVTGLHDSTLGTLTMQVWDEDTMAQIGTTGGALVRGCTVSSFRLGLTDAHSHDTVSGQAWIFSKFVGFTNGDVFPVMPGGRVRSATDLTPPAIDAAVSAAQPGDLVTLPGKAAVWGSGVTVAKSGIEIAGRGTNRTSITLASGFTGWAVVGMSNVFSDFEVRGNGGAEVGDGFLVTGPWNRFARLWTRLLHVAFYCQNYGLVDNCAIGDSWRVGRVIFPAALYAANYPLAWDDPRAMVFEDNLLYWSSAKISAGAVPLITSQVAQSFVVRHNRIDLGCPACEPAPAFDFHGDDQGSGLPVPGVSMQIYSNTVYRPAGGWAGNKFADVRGSRSMIYGNRVIGAKVGAGVTLREERPGDVPNYKVNNTRVFWNFDGPTGTDPMLVQSDPPPHDVAEGADYFTAPPAVIVGIPYPHPLRGAPPPPATPAAPVGGVSQTR